MMTSNPYADAIAATAGLVHLEPYRTILNCRAAVGVYLDLAKTSAPYAEALKPLRDLQVRLSGHSS